MTTQKPLQLGALFSDFRLLMILFITFRVVLFLGYQPLPANGAERGVGVGGDRAYHYTLSSLADQKLFPFRDWWSEFPPVWYLTTTSLYVALGSTVSYDRWSLVLGVLVIASEAGTLIMVKKIGTRLHGAETGIALAWIYAICIAPVIFMWWNFDTLVTFFTLLGIWLLLIQQDVRSASLIALGALTKFISLLLFGALIRFYPVKRTIRFIALTSALFIVAYIPLFALNSNFALISLTAQFNKPSYQTIWALLDQNYTTGNFGTVESHLSAEGVRDGTVDRNPAVIPSVVRLGGAILVGVFVYIRTRRFDQLGVVAFFGATLLIFYLQSQGWSPQWLTLIIPLILLVFPNRNGVLLTVMLSLLAFIEYPYIFVRTGDTVGAILPDNPLFALWELVVIARTVILIGVCYQFYQKLRQQPNPDLPIG